VDRGELCHKILKSDMVTRALTATEFFTLCIMYPIIPAAPFQNISGYYFKTMLTVNYESVSSLGLKVGV
jgi:hypothetical protein